MKSNSDEKTERAKQLLDRLLDRGHEVAPAVLVPVASTVGPVPFPAYYENSTGMYYLKADSGRYVRMPQRDLAAHLVSRFGCRGEREKGEPLSDVENGFCGFKRNMTCTMWARLQGIARGWWSLVRRAAW
jgi:hypothetical protein